jgi:RHS repeat-associated protein
LSLRLIDTKLYQENHYDPWGQNLVGLETVGAPNHRFQFNGKEKVEDFGLNWSDHGARFRGAGEIPWTTMDPLAEKFPEESPYTFGHNNPLRFSDPDGRIAVDENPPPCPDCAGNAAVQEVQKSLETTQKAIENLGKEIANTVSGALDPLANIVLNLTGISLTSADRKTHSDGANNRKGDGTQREHDITYLQRTLAAGGTASGRMARNPLSPEVGPSLANLYGVFDDLGKSLGVQMPEAEGSTKTSADTTAASADKPDLRKQQPVIGVFMPGAK